MRPLKAAYLLAPYHRAASLSQSSSPLSSTSSNQYSNLSYRSLINISLLSCSHQMANLKSRQPRWVARSTRFTLAFEGRNQRPFGCSMKPELISIIMLLRWRNRPAPARLIPGADKLAHSRQFGATIQFVCVWSQLFVYLSPMFVGHCRQWSAK